jgi:hypothetical protein
MSKPVPTRPQEDKKFYNDGKARRDPNPLADDDRTIEAVHFYRGGGYEVGKDGVTEIVGYEEQGNGQHVKVPFVAVYRGSEIAVRIPVHCEGLSSICYRTEYDKKQEQQNDEENDKEQDSGLPF